MAPSNGGAPVGVRVSSTRQVGRVYSDNAPAATGAKYPLISTTRSVVWVTKASILPPVPAGAIAAFATIVPVGSFSVDTIGRLSPVGYTVRYATGPGGTKVKFKEYATAVDGTSQLLDRIGSVRLLPPVKAPVVMVEGAPGRVSTSRQGVIG